MTMLSRIANFIQPCVLAISSVINAQVTIVDENLTRIGGSGLYAAHLGSSLNHDSIYRHTLKTGKSKISLDTETEEICRNCNNRANCHTLAGVSYPIHYAGKVVGIISISAFDEGERAYIVANGEKIVEFCSYISLLIESQLQSLEYADHIKQQQQAVIRKGSNIIGSSPKMLAVFDLADRVAWSDSTVLITGESGTGKEEIAKYLHSQSPRKNGPMISINCGAIPESLVESELFGYEGGSFTGANKQGAKGKFELANKGTLFLDEIGELPLPAQTKLLRVLQERVIDRVGGKKPIPVDVRVLCATNQDLLQMIRDHRFREDLYYRLNVIPMEMPPLREREDDILQIARHYLQYYADKLHKTCYGFEQEVERILSAYAWPGNVRELRNVMEYLVNLAPGPWIRIQDLPESLRSTQTVRPVQTLAEMMHEYEKKILSERLKPNMTYEEKTALAAQLGINKATLYRKISQHQL